MVEIYGPERLLVNSAGDWGPSKPTAVPDFILAMRKRGHEEPLIRRMVYENPAEVLSARAGTFSGRRCRRRESKAPVTAASAVQPFRLRRLSPTAQPKAGRLGLRRGFGFFGFLTNCGETQPLAGC